MYLGVADVTMDGALLDHLVVMRRMPNDRRLHQRLNRTGIGDELRARSPACSPTSTGEPGGARRWTGRPRATPCSGAGRRAPATSRSSGWAPTPCSTRTRSPSSSRWRGNYLRGRGPLFEERIARGCSCDGHGDLQADDIFCLDDGPRILDCIEFGDEYRYGDVLADVAFLAMDLERLGHVELARTFLDHYRELSGDRWPRSLEHHHIAYRAHVRAKVACLRATQGDPVAGDEARALHTLARRHLELGEVRLVLVGGLPGTGKSTLARELGARLGAVVLSSDELRKDLAGLERTTSAAAAPHEGIYSPAQVLAVYDRLLQEGAALLERGESVVLDASWTAADTRGRARTTAERSAATMTELRCEAPMDLAVARIEARAARGGALSDADARVAAALAAAADPWPEAVAIDTTGGLGTTVAAAVRGVRSPGSSA